MAHTAIKKGRGKKGGGSEKMQTVGDSCKRLRPWALAASRPPDTCHDTSDGSFLVPVVQEEKQLAQRDTITPSPIPGRGQAGPPSLLYNPWAHCGGGGRRAASGRTP